MIGSLSLPHPIRIPKEHLDLYSINTVHNSNIHHQDGPLLTKELHHGNRPSRTLHQVEVPLPVKNPHLGDGTSRTLYQMEVPLPVKDPNLGDGPSRTLPLVMEPLPVKEPHLADGPSRTLPLVQVPLLVKESVLLKGPTKTPSTIVQAVSQVDSNNRTNADTTEEQTQMLRKEAVAKKLIRNAIVNLKALDDTVSGSLSFVPVLKKNKRLTLQNSLDVILEDKDEAAVGEIAVKGLVSKEGFSEHDSRPARSQCRQAPYWSSSQAHHSLNWDSSIYSHEPNGSMHPIYTLYNHEDLNTQCTIFGGNAHTSNRRRDDVGHLPPLHHIYSIPAAQGTPHSLKSRRLQFGARQRQRARRIVYLKAKK